MTLTLAKGQPNVEPSDASAEEDFDYPHCCVDYGSEQQRATPATSFLEDLLGEG